jgi:peptide deformylase
MSLVDQSTPKTHNVITLFNPKVLEYSEETVMSEEGCLSYPNLFLKVSRPKSVKLQYCLADEIETVKTFYGLQARIVLHELDHLEGKLFTDSVGPTSLRLARARRNKRRKNSQAA